MTIDNRPCPRCNVPNTARLAEGIAVCFNCRASWRTDDGQGEPAQAQAHAPAGAAQPPPPQERTPAPPPEAPPYRFSARELARLATYRAAVAAGFYNEGLEASLEESQDERLEAGRDAIVEHVRPEAA